VPIPHLAAAAAIVALAALLLGPGYLLALRILPEDDTEPADPPGWPEVEVIVPVHEEAGAIAEKVENLRELDYPFVAFRIVDGASSDGTPERAASAFAGDARFAMRRAAVADKTAQINLALASGVSPWVLVTDADSRLGPDTLRRLVRKGESDARIAAIGATVHPAGAVASERLHWAFADGLRLRESARGAASIVTAPCYLFRREVVPSFPPDVVADDVHVAFRSAAAGRRVAFVAADVSELRNPVSLGEMARHKYRKGHAYLREVFRFLPQAGSMAPRSRAVFLWRAAQMLVVPPAAAILAVLLAVVLTAAGPAGWVVAAGGFLLVLSGKRLRAAAGLAAVLTAALLAAATTLPFYRQRASFAKIDASRKSVPDPAAP